MIPIDMKRALLFWGGWPGHQPEAFAGRLAAELAGHGFEPELVNSLEGLADAEALRRFDLIVPGWTMGTLTPEQSRGLRDAVRAGVGLGGLHGGMGDAFRGDLDYEWMVGGHFVGHPHVGAYTVRVGATGHPVTATLPAEFAYESEQYYLLVDPAVEVLAEADYVWAGGRCVMPVAWVRPWGEGRVFYSALGHDPAELDRFPASLELAVRGLRWAARDL